MSREEPWLPISYVNELSIFEDHKLLTESTENPAIPELFKMLTPKNGKRDQGDAFIRWRVEVPGDGESATGRPGSSGVMDST